MQGEKRSRVTEIIMVGSSDCDWWQWLVEGRLYTQLVDQKTEERIQPKVSHKLMSDNGVTRRWTIEVVLGSQGETRDKHC